MVSSRPKNIWELVAFNYLDHCKFGISIIIIITLFHGK